MSTRVPASGAADRVAIDLLGGFRVRTGDTEIGAGAWPTRRSAQLVQLLALTDRRALARDQAIDALWPQLDPEAGAANLRKAAHHARQALGRDDAVVLRGGQALLLPDSDVDIDAARFERAAGAALTRGDRRACARAAALWGGELLPESRYEEWVEAPRTRLRQCYLQLLRAAGLWERLAQEEPTDEPAHRELMRAALGTGSRPVAIRWYARLKEALARELGVRPDRQTEALYARCIEGMGAAGGPAFQGRQLELAQVAAILRAPPEARPGGIVLRRPAGIGKSAFCRQVAARAGGEGWRVITVTATQDGQPYGAVAAAVEQAVLSDRTVLDAIGEPARAVLSRLTPLVPAPATMPAGPQTRHQVLGALRRVLLGAAPGQAGGPAGAALLIVDDAHLVDESSADTLLHLAATGRPVVMLLAMRAEPAHPALARGLARLQDGSFALPLDLGPLDRDAAASLVAHAARDPLDADTIERIVSAAEGLPFALLELARAARPRTPLRLPATAAEAIARRLVDVDPQALAALRRLALGGDAFDTSAVVALTGRAEPEAFALLDCALSAGILVVSDGRYRFRHELVRQALAEGVSPHQRMAIHRDAALRLAGLDAPPSAVARHWLAGGRPDEAAPWLLVAARAALGLGAFADALGCVDALLGPRPGHVEALCLRAEALDAMGDLRTLAAYDAAASAMGEPANHDLRARRALATVKMGDPQGALARLPGLRPSTVEGRLAEALAYCGCAALGCGDPTVGAAKAAQCRRLALESGDHASLIIASWANAAAAHARGELQASVWADLHDTRALPHLAVNAFDGQLCITQRFLYGARPYGEVIAFTDALAAEARRLGAARGHAFATTLRGEARLLSGDLDGADWDLAEGARLHRAIRGTTGEAFSLQRRAEVAWHRGRAEEADRLLDEALDVARQSEVGFHLLDRIYGARVAMRRDPAAALAALEDAQEAVRGPLETCPGCRITFAVPAAIAAARAGRLDLAEGHAGQAEYLARVVMRLPAWDAGLEEVHGHLALARGDAARAVARFETAADGFASAGQPLDARRCAALARRPTLSV